MIVDSLKNSGLLIDSAIETVKHEIEKHGGFLGAMIALMAISLTGPMTCYRHNLWVLH